MNASSSKIEGTVTDSKTGEHLMGANIMLDGTMLGTASDENGSYIISNVSIGSYTLKAMFIGYETIEKEIRIEADQQYLIDLALNPSAIELQETKVTAETRKEKMTEAPASMEIITSRDLKRESTTNIGSYLKGLKGVDFTSSGINNYSISIRGFNSSFNTRVLTLTDGRVANIPALRVINYSTVPQSMDDVERMEVILGPATALYGANAHSGVVNIISKPPSQSQGFTMSVSGSNDERKLRKINSRWAAKLSDNISIKLSGMYLHGYEWPYISEEEYKSHLDPWTGTPGRVDDDKDNNPWNSNHELGLTWSVNNDLDSVRIGNGEPDHGCSDYNFLNQASCTANGHTWNDWDGDGVAGEDWFNGYDDDNDGLVDEDYFIADGIDNDEDGVIDEEIDYATDEWYDGYDNDQNGNIDDAEEIKTARPHRSSNWGANIDSRNILIFQGRKDSLIDKKLNPWYTPGVNTDNSHVFGTYKYDEENVELLFDVFLFDCGLDGYCWDDSWTIGEKHQAIDARNNLVFDENNLPIYIDGPDSGENDGIFDTGDGLYKYEGDNFDDLNGDGIYQTQELYSDDNNDGLYTPPDYVDNYRMIDDINGDNLPDYPDFEVDNRKVEFRLDFDPNEYMNLTWQSGYSWTKTQQVTGTGRYLADGFEYIYYQLRGRYKNWYSQAYLNQSFGGNTRGYLLGNHIFDQSKNYAFQIQNNIDASFINTSFVWGLDYFKTMPFSNGTILNDGPNGYDNNGNNIFVKNDGIDNDDDGIIDETENGNPDHYCYDGGKDGFRAGKLWNCGEGIDEPDEWDDPQSNEYGLYYQSKTELFGTSRFEFITAARLDYHDLLEEGIQFAPKLGFIYKLDEKSSFRLTYGKAFNTPNSITLFTDLFIQRRGIIDFYLRGNKDGTPYPRVGIDGTVSAPGYYTENNTFKTYSSLGSDYFTGNANIKPYTERVMGAPYFFNIEDSAPADMIPLDTFRYLIYIPELNGDGVLYNADESYHIPNVEPIKTEKIQTFEFGYKGFLGNRVQLTMDYYLSYYQDFFSPPTVITPLVVKRVFDSNNNDITNIDNINVIGIMPVNDFGSNPPYSTSWDGKDNDGDWEIWASEFGWWDDKDGNGDPQDPGEWGFIDYFDFNDSSNYRIYHPHEIIKPNSDSGIEFETHDSEGNEINKNWLIDVGIDEYHPTVGMAEYDQIETGLIDANGNSIVGDGRAYSLPHMVLSPMNYGNVMMQGLDLGLTYLIPEKGLVIDGNFSWYGTTNFYNQLTRKNDPINAPQYKWNSSIKWKSPIGGFMINYRHVDKFEWNDGIWAGSIGPYDIIDLHYNLDITKYTVLSISALNLFNDVHRELIGGAEMGRQIVIRMTANI